MQENDLSKGLAKSTPFKETCKENKACLNPPDALSKALPNTSKPCKNAQAKYAQDALLASPSCSIKNKENPPFKNKVLEPVFHKINDFAKNNFDTMLSLNQAVDLKCSLNKDQNKELIELIYALRPWRKGPFRINGHFIDSEWQSFIKYDILREHLKEIKGKNLADVGCNNGYYMFKALEFDPASITGFDPSAKFYLQFLLINALAKTKISFKLEGVQDLVKYPNHYDFILALGILYHRRDPISTLKELKCGLKKNGTLILDTLYIQGEHEFCLFPRKTYAKMSNIYFIPSILALRNWCERAGLGDFEVIKTLKTSFDEQRKSEFSSDQSLEDFLSKDGLKSIEGYDAPRRVYIKVRG